MFKDWKTILLSILTNVTYRVCNSYQYLNDIFCKNKKKYLINMKSQEVLNSQHNLEKEEESWEIYAS